MKPIFPGVALAITLFAAAPAGAHITLSETQAPSGSTYVGYFRVGHGCDGSATTGLRIEIPTEVTGAKPQPKPGWTLSIEREPAGLKGAGRVSAITWSGGPLPDDEWDAFGLYIKLPARTGPLAFPVIQTCEHGEARWTDIPAPGQSVAHPAPILTLTPAESGDGMMGMPMSMPMGH